MYETIDYAGWLASERSSWLGLNVRKALLDGIAEWGVWAEWEEESRPGENESLIGWLSAPALHLPEIRTVIERRLAVSVRKFDLPEAPDVLAERLVTGLLVSHLLRLTGVTASQIRKAKKDLKDLRARTGLPSMGIMDHAISVYEAVEALKANRDLFIRDTGTGEAQRVRLI